MQICRFITSLILISGLSFQASAQFEKAEVQVSGLTCSMCQLATEKALKTIDFVSDIKPDLNKNVFVLTFKKDKTINFDLIKKKVKDAGFSVSKLVATFNFNKLSVSNNSVFNYGGNSYRIVNVQDKVLNGNVRLTLISNGFIPNGDFKKYASQISDPSYKTGMSNKEKVFHVTISNY
jgi:copper chaperone CopZ